MRERWMSMVFQSVSRVLFWSCGSVVADGRDCCCVREGIAVDSGLREEGDDRAFALLACFAWLLGGRGGRMLFVSNPVQCSPVQSTGRVVCVVLCMCAGRRSEALSFSLFFLPVGRPHSCWSCVAL